VAFASREYPPAAYNPSFSQGEQQNAQQETIVLEVDVCPSQCRVKDYGGDVKFVRVGSHDGHGVSLRSTRKRPAFSRVIAAMNVCCCTGVTGRACNSLHTPTRIHHHHHRHHRRFYEHYTLAARRGKMAPLRARGEGI